MTMDAQTLMVQFQSVIQDAPNADFDLSGNPISLGETLVVTNNSSNGAVSYLWDLGDGTTSTNDRSIYYL